MSDSKQPPDYSTQDDFDNEDCWMCGGDGYVFDCFDGFCEDADVGCDICTKRCEICNPRISHGGTDGGK